jgi:hypothetical protein
MPEPEQFMACDAVRAGELVVVVRSDISGDAVRPARPDELPYGIALAAANMFGTVSVVRKFATEPEPEADTPTESWRDRAPLL